MTRISSEDNRGGEKRRCAEVIHHFKSVKALLFCTANTFTGIIKRDKHHLLFVSRLLVLIIIFAEYMFREFSLQNGAYSDIIFYFSNL